MLDQKWRECNHPFERISNLPYTRKQQGAASMCSYVILFIAFWPPIAHQQLPQRGILQHHPRAAHSFFFFFFFLGKKKKPESGFRASPLLHLTTHGQFKTTFSEHTVTVLGVCPTVALVNHTSHSSLSPCKRSACLKK